MPSPAKHRTSGFVAAALASSFWGCGFFFGKIALTEMNVGTMVLYRFVFATLGLLPLLIIRRPSFNAAEWRMLLFASFLGVPLQFLLEFKGLSLTTVSHASLMVGTMPVILAVGATIFAKERLHPLGWVALTLSTAGAVLIAFGHHRTLANGPSLTGDLFVVAAMFVALFWFLFNKRLMEVHDHIVVTAYGIAAGTLMLALYVPFAYGPLPVHGISLKVWAALIASGLLCTATTTLLWNWGMTQVPASQAGVLLNLEPLVGSLLGVFLLSEHLSGLAWLGGGMILTAAISLTTRSSPALEEPAII